MKSFLAFLLCFLMLVGTAVMTNAADSNPAIEDSEYVKASQAIDEEYGYDGDDLGASYSPEATTFKVWAPLATEVKLNRFATGSDSETGVKNLGTIEMEKLMDAERFTGIWTVTVVGDIVNTYYTYSITTPNVLGNDVKTYETQDVYSKATGVNGKRSMVVDLDSTDPDGWEDTAHVYLDQATESYVWEVHIKDFSYNPNSGVSESNRGKYLAFTENGTTLNNEGEISTCIDYLKKLGITTVQINPFYDFGSVFEGGDDTQFNWGYDPMNYNVPEGSYSSNPYDGNVRINECKQMIQALHNAGLSVVMDVVYNHTYITDTCFNRTVPSYYYRMNKDGTFSDGSGCGNETASERRMFRNYMIQSCLYWVNEYHIDGFRFDLMGLHDKETMELIREALDAVDERITMWGEGWDMGSNFPSTTWTGEKLMKATMLSAGSINSRIGFFNEQIRDSLKGSVFQQNGKGLLQGGGSAGPNLILNMRANPQGYNIKSPSQIVTYTSCHDNQTLWDRLAYSQGSLDFRKRNSTYVAQNKLCAALLHTSQGITFTLAGEEFARSKDNDHNSYCSSVTENMIDWSLVKSNADIVSYYTGMRLIRQNFSALMENNRDAEFKVNYISPVYEKVSGVPVLVNSDGFAGLWTNTTEGEWDNLLVIMNNKNQTLNYTYQNANTDWVIIANDQQAGVRKLAEVNDNKFTLPPYSAIIAVDKASFEAVGVQNERGSVKVTAIDDNTGKKIESYSITGEYGDIYSLTASESVGDEYEFIRQVGEASGVFSDEYKEVIMYYNFFVPESVKADLNGDGKININDATVLQLHLAGKNPLAPEYEAIADVTTDGKITVDDVTMIQRYVAQLSVGLGTVTVNHYKSGTTEKAASSVVHTGRVGSSYTAAPISLLGMAVNNSNLPQSTVKHVYGNVDVNYYYDVAFSEINLHIKNNSGTEIEPALYVWGQKNGSDSSAYNGSWPGRIISEADSSGWYSKTVSIDNSDTAYNIIVSNKGSNKSADCKGFVESEMWLVIVDNKEKVTMDFYNVNPDENPAASPIYSG